MYRPLTVMTFIVFFSFFIGIAAQASIKKPYLYEVSYNGNKSYMLGTIHIGVGTEDLPQWVIDLYDQALNHAFEMIPVKSSGAFLDFNKFSHYQGLLQLFLNRDELPNQFSNFGKGDLSKETQEELVKYGVPAEFAGIVKNKFDMFLLAAPLIFKERYKGLDHELILRSIRTGKNIIELENNKVRADAQKLSNEPEYNINFFLSQDFSAQEIVEIQDAIVEDVEIYKTGEITESDRTGSDSSDMIYRNNHWMITLVPLLKSNFSFVTVGLNHLYGENGLISLLLAEGFEVNRIDNYNVTNKDKRYR